MRQWGGQSLVPGQSVVLVVDNKAERASVAEEIKAQVQNGTLSVVENEAGWNGLSNVDTIIAYGATSIDNTLSNALKVLKPGGNVVLCVPQNGGVSDEDVSDKLMFSGFVNTKASKVGEFSEIASSKPNWEVGASQKLNLKRPAAANTDAKKIWSSTTGAEEDLVDEDSLLNEADRTAKPKTKADDCEIGATKKACKNCTCGRADEPAAAEPAKPKLTKEMLENPGVGSNCGSCGLGDAFRCGGCPYRGLPAFKTGEKITLPDNYMADDI